MPREIWITYYQLDIRSLGQYFAIQGVILIRFPLDVHSLPVFFLYVFEQVCANSFPVCGQSSLCTIGLWPPNSPIPCSSRAPSHSQSNRISLLTLLFQAALLQMAFPVASRKPATRVPASINEVRLQNHAFMLHALPMKGYGPCWEELNSCETFLPDFIKVGQWKAIYTWNVSRDYSIVPSRSTKLDSHGGNHRDDTFSQPSEQRSNI